MGKYEENLVAWGRAADDEIYTLEQALLNKNAEIESLHYLIGEKDAIIAAKSDTIARKNARIHNLKAKLDECLGKEPAPSEPVEPATVFGSSTGAHTYDEFTAMAGAPLKVRRSYEVDVPTDFTKRSTGYDIGRCATVVSMKPDLVALNTRQLDNKILYYLSTIPTDHRVHLIIWHEPEDNIENGSFSAAEYKQGQVVMRNLVNTANMNRAVPIRFGGNWMSWSVNPKSGRNAEDYYPGDNVWDFLSWDGYEQKGTTRSPVEIFGPCVNFNNSHGLRFAVAETGVSTSKPSDYRVEWIIQNKVYASTNNAEFWCYWDGSFADFELITVDEFKAVVY